MERRLQKDLFHESNVHMDFRIETQMETYVHVMQGSAQPQKARM